MSTGLGWGGSDFLPGESNGELQCLMVSWSSLLALAHGVLVSLPYEPMETLMTCLWESNGLLLLYHPSSLPPVLVVLSSRELPVFSSYIS